MTISEALDRSVTLIRCGEWSEGLALADAEIAAGRKPDGTLSLLMAIARVRSDTATVDAISPALAGRGDPDDLRRLLVGPLVQRKRLEDATRVLGALIAAYPHELRDRHQRSGLYARLGRWNEAIADIDEVATADPDDAAAEATRLPYRIVSG